jgi:HD-GYP domain-containing protein (c-di-GMP phosphodiesterase class II)
VENDLSLRDGKSYWKRICIVRDNLFGINFMSRRRISLSDIVIGEPLPWDIYDSSNKLLLRKEFIVESEQQIETLLARGLFAEAKPSASTSTTVVINRQVEKPSALRLINQANKRLGRLLYNLLNETDLEAKIMEVVGAIKQAVDINQHVALGSIMLNRAVIAYPVRHCVDTAVVSLLVARNLKLPETEIDIILAAALTMNAGMLRQQEQLQEKAGALSDEDKNVIKTHPQAGIRLLKQAGVKNDSWLLTVLMHHENENGSGYPLGKTGLKIPMGAKIISIADRYCATISPRSYRKALLPTVALRSLFSDEKQNVDQSLATIFVGILGLYPAGIFVKLINGEISVVTGPGEVMKTPMVHSLIGSNGAKLAFPISRDTSRSIYAIQDSVDEMAIRVPINMQTLWGDDAGL